MQVTATVTVEVPSLSLVIEAGQVTTFPEVSDPAGRALYAAALGKDPKDVTEEDAKAVQDAVLANPHVTKVDGQPTKPKAPKGQVGREDDEGANL